MRFKTYIIYLSTIVFDVVLYLTGVLVLVWTTPEDLYLVDSVVSEPIKIETIIEEPEIIEEVYPEEYNEDEFIEIIKENCASEIDILAHIINAECGGWNWCSDEMCYYTGSVVLNRVYSDYFPNTLEEVIFQEGQYSPVCNGSFYNEPNERSVRIATDLIAYGSQLPENVLFQANFKQGDGVYAQVQNMYFCYKD